MLIYTLHTHILCQTCSNTHMWTHTHSQTHRHTHTHSPPHTHSERHRRSDAQTETDHHDSPGPWIQFVPSLKPPAVIGLIAVNHGSQWSRKVESISLPEVGVEDDEGSVDCDNVHVGSCTSSSRPSSVRPEDHEVLHLLLLHLLL